MAEQFVVYNNKFVTFGTKFVVPGEQSDYVYTKEGDSVNLIKAPYTKSGSEITIV